MTTSAPVRMVYDEFAGPTFDPEKWTYLERPLPDGTIHRAQEPAARIEVANGVASVEIERFTNSHNTLQAFDTTKHVLVSTGQIQLPEHGTATFEIEQSVRLLGAQDLDPMYGFGAFHILDFTDGLVFDLAATDRHVYAVHEQFDPDPYAPALFTHVVEDPFRVTSTPGEPHRFRMTLDSVHNTVVWAIDDIVVYRVTQASIPSSAHIALGVLAGVRLGETGSVSLQGQGLHATWSAPIITITHQ